MTSIQSAETRWSESTYDRLMGLAAFAVMLKIVLFIGILIMNPTMNTKIAVLVGGLGFVVLAIFATMIITSRPGYRLSTTGIIIGFVTMTLMCIAAFDTILKMLT